MDYPIKNTLLNNIKILSSPELRITNFRTFACTSFHDVFVYSSDSFFFPTVINTVSNFSLVYMASLPLGIVPLSFTGIQIQSI